jgi:hypothetical protein
MFSEGYMMDKHILIVEETPEVLNILKNSHLEFIFVNNVHNYKEADFKVKHNQPKFILVVDVANSLKDINLFKRDLESRNIHYETVILRAE